jgi:hypothetical protein
MAEMKSSSRRCEVFWKKSLARLLSTLALAPGACHNRRGAGHENCAPFHALRIVEIDAARPIFSSSSLALARPTGSA